MKIAGEKRWLFGLAIVLIVVTTLPYVLAFFSEGQVWKFTGFLIGVEDGNSYIAKMLNGASGEWLFHTPYTSMPQNGLLAFLPYILLGKLVSPPGAHDQLVVLFQLFRWAGIFVFVFASYDFAALFVEKTWQRRWAVVLVACGGGLGWLYFVGLKVLWGVSLPLELYSPESFGFLEVFSLPHLLFARALMLWGLAWFLKSPERPWTGTESLSNAAVWFAVGLFQPLHLAIGDLLIVITLAVHLGLARSHADENARTRRIVWKESLRRAGILLAASAFWILYNAYIFLRDSFGAVWMSQNVLLSPTFGSYLLAYGWLLPLAVLGAYWSVLRRNLPGIFLSVWAALLPVLAYAPTNVQRRLVEGEWLAFLLLALMAWERFFLEKRKALTFILMPCFFTTLILYSGTLGAALTPGEPLYLPASDVACYKHLAELARPDAVVLANRQTSNSLPAWANVTTLVGHGPESAGKDTLEPLVKRFFAGKMPEAEMRAFTARYAIHYVLLAKDDQNLTGKISGMAGLFQTVFENTDCQILTPYR